MHHQKSRVKSKLNEIKNTSTPGNPLAFGFSFWGQLMLPQSFMICRYPASPFARSNLGTVHWSRKFGGGFQRPNWYLNKTAQNAGPYKGCIEASWVTTVITLQTRNYRGTPIVGCSWHILTCSYRSPSICFHRCPFCFLPGLWQPPSVHVGKIPLEVSMVWSLVRFQRCSGRVSQVRRWR